MVCVTGLGYIGLPTALMLASHGVKVVGVDTDAALVERLKIGRVDFQEEGLAEIYASARKAGILFTDRNIPADVYIVSVPTPCDPETQRLDPKFVVAAVDSILDVAPKGALIIIESTVSPGAIDANIVPLIRERRLELGKDVRIAHAPERIIPGRMIAELVANSRVIGSDDPGAAREAKELYQTFCKGEIILTSLRAAEMCKVVENTFRAVNIAFANELALLCRAAELDVREVIRICNMHPRVNILQPGPGVGGHCISVDPRFLVADYPEQTPLIAAAIRTNDAMPGHVLGRIRQVMDATGLNDFSRVGLCGLAYKENVDDFRESPTLQLLRAVEVAGHPAPVVCDPHVRDGVVPRQCRNLDEFLEQVDLVVIMVRHAEFIDSMEKFRGKTVLDCCGVCELPGVFRI